MTKNCWFNIVYQNSLFTNKFISSTLLLISLVRQKYRHSIQPIH